MSFSHHYLERHTGKKIKEKFFADPLVRFLYHEVRENAPWLFSAFTSPVASRILGAVNYDLPFSSAKRLGQMIRDLEIKMEECLEPASLCNPRALFERKILYEIYRPMVEDPLAIVSPSDSRMLPLNLSPSALIPVKGKFFDLPELCGNRPWHAVFLDGKAAVFRLTPDKYHYNHVPVSGRVEEIFMTDGRCHACHPDAVVREVSPFSRNRRLITLINTDVPGGSGMGLVAMAEVVALMIGGIRQACSERAYDHPKALLPGMFVHRGCPKSLFYPGSSTVVLLFEKDRMEFDRDLVSNSLRRDVTSCFSKGFGLSLVETEVRVRESIGRGLQA
ncbi:phosphatidylserine decarboxylase [Desulfobotulus alkaliphilus]|uniref:Phosphatidylserine decarboxylase n=1 Tax=Desulfobotulus alkaliphilus TaxID=622671 RepID=A0A562RYP5_9BACT|nr:phosphatidylserine decarboxylase [Desulfobotulus alkaliphilus]TWI73973.1 phosphatidylserine decarboxylase [Desulfobotulus alkaliphilus]